MMRSQWLATAAVVLAVALSGCCSTGQVGCGGGDCGGCGGGLLGSLNSCGSRVGPCKPNWRPHRQYNLCAQRQMGLGSGGRGLFAGGAVLSGDCDGSCGGSCDGGRGGLLGGRRLGGGLFAVEFSSGCVAGDCDGGCQGDCGQGLGSNANTGGTAQLHAGQQQRETASFAPAVNSGATATLNHGSGGLGHGTGGLGHGTGGLRHGTGGLGHGSAGLGYGRGGFGPGRGGLGHQAVVGGGLKGGQMRLAGRGCGRAGCGIGGRLCDRCRHPYGGAKPHTPTYTGPAGPPTPQYAYPYYTTRGPRDFFVDDPPTIGW